MWNAHLNRRKTLPTKISFLCVVTHSSSKSLWSAHRSRYWLCHTVDHDRIWFCTTSVTYIYIEWLTMGRCTHSLTTTAIYGKGNRLVGYWFVWCGTHIHASSGDYFIKEYRCNLWGFFSKCCMAYSILQSMQFAFDAYAIYFFFMFVIEWNLLEWNWY